MQGPFNVGSRTNNQEWFELPLAEVWETSVDLLAFTARAFELRVQVYVLMSNHYHLMVEAPQGNLSQAMNYFQREFSKSLGRQTHKINHLFGGPYFARLIPDAQYTQTLYRYFYRNPIEAGMADRVEDYPFSSLRILLAQARSALTIHDPVDFVEQPEEVLSWLNAPFKNHQKDCIERGLRKAEFQFMPDRNRGNAWTDDLVFSTDVLRHGKVAGT